MKIKICLFFLLQGKPIRDFVTVGIIAVDLNGEDGIVYDVGSALKPQSTSVNLSRS